MKAYIKRYLPHPFSLLLPAALAWAASLLAGCTDRVDEWIPDGRTASVTLHVPMADIRSTHTTDEEYKAAEECNLQIFLCLFLEKLNMPQNTPVTKAS